MCERARTAWVCVCVFVCGRVSGVCMLESRGMTVVCACKKSNLAKKGHRYQYNLIWACVCVCVSVS